MGRIKLNCSLANSIQPLLGIWKSNQFNLSAIATFLMHCVRVLQIPCLIHSLCFSVLLFLYLCEFNR